MHHPSCRQDPCSQQSRMNGNDCPAVSRGSDLPCPEKAHLNRDASDIPKSSCSPKARATTMNRIPQVTTHPSSSEEDFKNGLLHRAPAPVRTERHPRIYMLKKFETSGIHTFGMAVQHQSPWEALEVRGFPMSTAVWLTSHA